MVPEGITVMPKGAIFKMECKKVLFNSFVMMQFSYFDYFENYHPATSFHGKKVYLTFIHSKKYIFLT